MQQQIVEQPQESLGNKALSVGYKVGGWHYRLKAIGLLIFSVILILGGIIAAILLKQFSLLTLSGLGIILLLGAWFYWHRARSLVKGRFY